MTSFQFGRRPASADTRRSCTVAAAWLLVLAFACVPALSRVHDHLSPSDRTAGLRFSKNGERPIDKHTQAPLIAAGPLRLDEGVVPGERQAAPEIRLPANRFFFAPNPLRAPPAR
jgi:hypothetical protein